MAEPQRCRLVHAPDVADWPPLAALRQWLQDGLALSRAGLAADQPG